MLGQLGAPRGTSFLRRRLKTKKMPHQNTLLRYFRCPRPPVAPGHHGALSAGKLSGITTSADAGDHSTPKGQRVPQDGVKNPVSKISSSKCPCSMKGNASRESPPGGLCSSLWETEAGGREDVHPAVVLGMVLPSAAASLMPLLAEPAARLPSRGVWDLAVSTAFGWAPCCTHTLCLLDFMPFPFYLELFSASRVYPSREMASDFCPLLQARGLLRALHSWGEVHRDLI